MRMVGTLGHSSDVKLGNGIPQTQGSEALARLLSGLDRMRPELGPLADELINLLVGGDISLAADVRRGIQDT